MRVSIKFSELVQLMSPVNYISAFKTFMSMLKTNQEFVGRANLLEFPIASISKTIYNNFKILELKYASLQIRMLAELQKLFGCQFHGTSHIVRTLVDLQIFAQQEDMDNELQKLLPNLKSLLWTELNSSSFYVTLLSQCFEPSDAELRFVLELCLEIIDQLIRNANYSRAALPSDVSSNFCLLSIKFIAKHPKLIKTQSVLFGQFVLQISQLLHSDISVESFNFIERKLIRAMIHSDDYWMREISFKVFKQFLEIIKSVDLIANYFEMFQKLLNKFWNPSTNVSTLSQMYLIHIVRFIMRRHPMIVHSRVNDPQQAEILMQIAKPDCQRRFAEACEKLTTDPTADNYYQLMRQMTILRFCDMELERKTMMKLCDLIGLMKNCDWTVNAGLIIKIMQIIIATRNIQHKLVLLLKLNPALNIETTKPFDLKLTLLELLLSFIPHAELKQGLPSLLSRELNRLRKEPENCEITARMNRSFLTEFRLIPWDIIGCLDELYGENSIYSEEERLLEVLQQSRDLKSVHKCPPVEHAKNDFLVTSQHSTRLQMILSYSEMIEKHQLTEQDLQNIRGISSNFQRLSANP